MNARPGGKPPTLVSRSRIPLVLALLISLCACSAFQLGYRNADTYLHWRGGQYFDFQGESRADFESRVQRFLAWHRRAALPQYAHLAHDMAERLARGLSRADLVWGYDSLQSQLRESLRAAAGDSAEMLDALLPEQLENFEKRLARENRDFAAKHRLGSTPEERRRIRVERNIERLEDWFGSLTEDQLERVRLYSARAPLDDTLRERERKRLQQELLAMLRAKQARQRLAQWTVNWEQNREPDFERARNQNMQEYIGMLLDLDKMLSTEQRGRAVKRLRGFSADFSALAVDGAR